MLTYTQYSIFPVYQITLKHTQVKYMSKFYCKLECILYSRIEHSPETSISLLTLLTIYITIQSSVRISGKDQQQGLVVMLVIILRKQSQCFQRLYFYRLLYSISTGNSYYNDHIVISTVQLIIINTKNTTGNTLFCG